MVAVLTLVVASGWFDASRMSPVLSSSGAVPVVLRRPAAPVTVTLTDEDGPRCKRAPGPAQLACR
jgi:hypothetical protein